MKIWIVIPAVAGGLVFLAALVLPNYAFPPIESAQRGYRGTGMAAIADPDDYPPQIAANVVPEPLPPAEPIGEPASAIYQNLQVLGDIDAASFDRLMQAMTEWVSPEQGCAYCHGEEGNFADDSLYTKVVSRRMLQMTRTINDEWTDHVAGTGVTCYTCHRGQPVPEHVWFASPEGAEPVGMVGNRALQNAPAPEVGLASLPHDPFLPFLAGDDPNQIRVVGNDPLPNPDSRSSIKQAEWTYGLMMHFSQALGVNCTYCHNTRSFAEWDQSSPARITAWHGIQMVKGLNQEYLSPLVDQYPAVRLGPTGDAPKANCTTCHQGAYKPLFGVGMVDDYPSLAGDGGEQETAAK